MEQLKINYLPVTPGSKIPACGSWRDFQKKYYPSEIGPFDPRGVVCGEISGNLTALDFDSAGVMFEPWRKLVESEKEGLLERCYIEQTPSGGFHVFYRSESPARKNEKLARTEEGEVLIETRGAGGFCVVANTPGYFAISGDLDALEQLPEEDVQTLLSAAIRLNEYKKTAGSVARNSEAASFGDDWADKLREQGRGKEWILELLTAAGWKEVRETAAGLLVAHPYASNPEDNHIILHNDGHVYCFGTSAKNAPFEGDCAYSALDALALLLNKRPAAVKEDYYERFPEEKEDLLNLSGIAARVFDAERKRREEVRESQNKNKILISAVLDSIAENYPILNRLRFAGLKNAPAPQRFLALIPALSVVGALTCHKLAFSDKRSQNLAFCCVIPQAGGKERLLSIVEESLESGFSLSEDLTTRRNCRVQKFAKTEKQFALDLIESPVAIHTLNEFQDFLRNKAGDGYKNEAVTLFKDVFSKSHAAEYVPGLSATMKSILEERQRNGLPYAANYPAVNLFSVGTDEVFTKLSAQDLNDGFVRRVLFFYNPVQPKKPIEKDIFAVSSRAVIPEDVKEWIRRVQDLKEFSISISGELNPEAREAYVSAREENDAIIAAVDSPPVPLRYSFPEVFNKLISILAFARTEPGEEIIIEKIDVETAYKLIQISINDFEYGRKNMRIEISESKNAENLAVDRILSIIQRNPLCSRKVLFKIYKKKNALSVNDFDRILNSLISNKIVQELAGSLILPEDEKN